MPIRPLSNELQRKAENELNEVPSRVQEDLKYIRNWLTKQPHLNVRQDEQWLLSFLRGCKFSLERTKEKLDMFYTMRTMLPEFFAGRDPFLPEIQDILAVGHFLPLPKTAGSAAPRVLLIRNGITDPDKVHPINAIKVNLMIIDILLMEDDNFVVAGQEVIQDFKGASIGHMFSMTPSLMKKAMTCLLQAYPNRPKGMHFTNIPSFFDTSYNMLKPFLTDKMKSRVNIISGNNFDSLHKVIPRSILPKEYGGEGGCVDEITAEWKKKVESYRDWFLDDAKYCSNESKRPGKPKSASDFFGVEGSFRKLDVD